MRTLTVRILIIHSSANYSQDASKWPAGTILSRTMSHTSLGADFVKFLDASFDSVNSLYMLIYTSLAC
jgi:hypothetical protein